MLKKSDYIILLSLTISLTVVFIMFLFNILGENAELKSMREQAFKQLMLSQQQQLLLLQEKEREAEALSNCIKQEVDYISKTLKIYDLRRDSVSLVYKYAKQSDVATEVILALVMAESSFNSEANNSNRDIGLFQINTRYHNVDVHNVFTNIEYGISYLEYLVDKYNGNIYHALTHYNGGYNGYKNEKAITYANKVLDIANKLKIEV